MTQITGSKFNGASVYRQLDSVISNKYLYEKLLCCEKDNDVTEWNNWRKEHPDEEIWLEGITLPFRARLQRINLKQAKFKSAILREADLQFSELQGAIFYRARLARLDGARLGKALFYKSKLQGADFSISELQGADFSSADLRGSDFSVSNLEDASFCSANLQGVDINAANLRKVNFNSAKLQGADFRKALVDSETFIWGVKVNQWKEEEGYTDFAGVGLDSVRIQPGIKQLLEYNIRRSNWEEWYKKHCTLRCFVQLFWSISNYGRSAGRIMFTFLASAIAFALVYYFVPGLIKDLHGTSNWYSDLVRACYFSVVTMTTLGFGDMYANKQSMTGHLLLMFQVILGYVLLGALVTRFAALFTAGGPAGSFTPMDKETKELLAKLKEGKEKAK
jgi:hypothetical protein